MNIGKDNNNAPNNITHKKPNANICTAFSLVFFFYFPYYNLNNYIFYIFDCI